MSTSGNLDGKIIIVTGGRGILGLAVIEKLLAAGSRVCSLDIVGPVSLGRENEELDNLHHFVCDVSDKDEVDKTLRLIENTVGPISGLHNNAATKTADLERFFDSVEEYEENTWKEIMQTNLWGMFLMARGVGALMASRKNGSIVQTASIYGATMGPDQRIYEGSEYLGREISSPVSYTASKAGVHGLTNHLATYWGFSGVRVNTVTPGGIRSGQNRVFESKYSARVPLGRMAEASEVASAVTFLLSDDSSYITGHNLFVDGGLHAW